MDIADKVERFSLGLENLDRPIYRIFSAHWFRDILVKRRIGLVEPRMWDDPMENVYRSCKFETDGSTISMANLGLRWYGQCWTYNRDSDAMWRIYSPNKCGVRLETTGRKLLTHLHSSGGDKYIYLGAVSYLTKDQILEHLAANAYYDLVFNGHPDSIVKTLLMKRPEFDHEKEIRLLFHEHDATIWNRGVVEFPFDVNQLVTEVALDPRMSERDFLADRTEYLLLGLRAPIIKSDLYQLRNIRLVSPEPEA